MEMLAPFAPDQIMQEYGCLLQLYSLCGGLLEMVSLVSGLLEILGVCGELLELFVQ